MPRNREVRKYRITVVLSESLRDRIEVQADIAKRSVSDLVRLILEEWCDSVESHEAEKAEDIGEDEEEG
jgi:Arc/MetJ-type ribon-helix-helix transcriptional regulator